MANGVSDALACRLRRLRDLSLPSPLRPHARALRLPRAFASLSMARSGGYSEAVDSWRKGVYTSYTLS